MNIEIDRNQNRNYVSISMREEQIFSHEKSMLTYNEVPYFLPVSMRYVDEFVRVEYDTTGMQQISSAFLRQKVNREWMSWLVNGLLEIQSGLIEYMLSPDGMVLDPDFMFTDMERSKLFICYVPGERERVEKNIQPLLQYILENVDYNDQVSVKLAYALYHINDETGDIITTMKKCISDGEPRALAVRPAHPEDDGISVENGESGLTAKPRRGFLHRLFNRDNKKELLLNHASYFDEENSEEI